MDIKQDDLDKLKKITESDYEKQAIWFLNAFWTEYQSRAEEIWKYYTLISSIDEEGPMGSTLQQFDAHRFLERTGNPQTVVELSTTLAKKIRKGKGDKTVSLIEYLFFFFGVDLGKLVNAPQSSNKEEIDKAQKILDEANEKLVFAIKKAEEAEKARKEQVTTENDVERACNELKREEDLYKKTTTDLTFKSNDESKGIVFRNKAKNELEQHLAKDTLVLNRAKINMEAALKKAKIATDKANLLKEAADKSLNEAEEAFKKAQESLDEIKQKGGSGQGQIFFMEKKFEESKKFLPQSKGGISKQ